MNYILHKNNFNLIRFIAAFQVLIVHSASHFNLQFKFINYIKCFPGVPIFFFLSGYLISKSYINKKKYGNLIFFKNRVLRIYPALIACVLITSSFIFATDYFNKINFSYYKFFLWVFAQSSFFQTYNPSFMREFGVGVFNGSLWTIFVELQFYIITPILFMFFKKSKTIIFTIFIISIFANIYIKLFYDWNNIYFKLFYTSSLPWLYIFMIGFLMHQFKFLNDLASKNNIFLLLFLYILSINFIGDFSYNSSNSINPISVFILSLLILKFSTIDLRLPNKINVLLSKYDISYGTYIYHMPIINFLIYLDVFNQQTNFILTILLSITFSILSWIFIEKKFLKYKM
jgi:peptidoglycan/LPS O-acetylase OafA/YrhL